MTAEAEATITCALELYKSPIPDDAFYWRGQKGPCVFTRDDNDAERSALQLAFPESKLLLCIFHVLQAS